MKNFLKFRLLVAVFTAFASIACSGDGGSEGGDGGGGSQSPVEIEAYDKYNPSVSDYQKVLSITAMVDSVTIIDVVVNKGNCRLRGEAYRKLKYGQTSDIPLRCKKVLQVDIMTDDGDEFTYKF